MKTKIIPFDLETAEKIQVGEIAGTIKTRSGLSVKMLRTNMKAVQCVAAVVKLDNNSEFLGSFYASGKFYWGSERSDFDLVLEVPDNEPQVNSSYSIEQLNKLKEYTEQLMGVNQGVIDELSSMIQELRKTCNLSLKTEFKPFDKVLVRRSNETPWLAGFYSHKLGDKYCVCGDYYWECIPYEGNQELVGTCNEPKCK